MKIKTPLIVAISIFVTNIKSQYLFDPSINVDFSADQVTMPEVKHYDITRKWNFNILNIYFFRLSIFN